MSFFVKDKRFYKSFFSLMAVIALQQLLTFSVNMADNIMLGMYKETALSGASLVNQIQYMLQMLTTGVATGVVILGSQYWGEGNTAVIRRILALAVKMGALVGLVFTLAGALIPRQVLSLLTNKQEVIAEGVIYMRRIAPTYIIFTITNVLLLSMRSVQTTVIGFITAACSLVVNIFLNWCLIFGRCGLPALGTLGAATATLAARCVELIVVLVYLKFFDKKLHVKFRDWFKPDWEYLKPYLKISIPSFITSSTWGLGTTVQTAILGHVSASAISANSIAATLYQVATIFFVSSSSASGVVMGMSLGRGDKLPQIKQNSRTLQVLFILFGLASSALMLALREVIVGLYSLTPESIELTHKFIIILCITVIGTSYEFPASAGIIQTGGDTRYGFIVDSIFLWGIALPLSALSAFVFNWSPAVTFFLLKSDQLLKCIPNAIKCNRYRWVKKLT
ncbi:MAG: MATE family efflux transporter [Oscillospiraceae bacterium]|nr:MATE family efflux transporter [Oscillospiraceae bacterium]